ncbi:MAG: HAD family hydrolase [Candidatus Limiplasma sp.]|nr:HAD family hydrolase [Candidatus Limiplasma sp.]
MPRYTTILFDLDGTLLDTLDDLWGSCNFALRSCDMPERSREEVCRFVGNGVGNLIRRAVPMGTDPEQCARTLEAFKLYYAQHNADLTRPYDGIPEMLEELRKLGCKLGIVSNKNDENVKKLSLEQFGIEAALGEVPGVPRKPAPDGVRMLMEALGADPRRTLYVGDSDVDIETARNAGLPCLSVTWGFRGEEELREKGAAHFAHTPQDVVEFVR